MRLLFLFLDGVGLGPDDSSSNPLARADMPNLRRLLCGRSLVAGSAPLECERATLVALDACLGVSGFPQSATGQAVLLTGENIPAALGYHYGPKPNPDISRFLTNGNLFSVLRQMGKRAALMNAYPPRYFEAIHSGLRMYSAIPLAVTSAGIPLKTQDDLYAGRAIAADLTARGWREHLGMADAPLLTPVQAGQRLAHLAQEYDLAFFEFWLTDYLGHRQDMQTACALLEELDQVIGGLLDEWDDRKGLVLLTSDHGNLEDLTTRRHTLNPVPGLLVGAPALRHSFSQNLKDLSGVTPAIVKFLAPP